MLTLLVSHLCAATCPACGLLDLATEHREIILIPFFARRLWFQVVIANRVLAADPAADACITNVVFMGMGEPLHNYDSVMAAIDIMVHPRGLHMSHNKVTQGQC